MITLKTLLGLAFIGFFLAPPIDSKWLGDLPLECVKIVHSFERTSIRRSSLCSLKMFEFGTQFGTLNEINQMIQRCGEDKFNYFSTLNNEEKKELILKLESFKAYVDQNSDLIVNYGGVGLPTKYYDIKRLQVFYYYEKIFKDIREKEYDFCDKLKKNTKKFMTLFKSAIELFNPLVPATSTQEVILSQLSDSARNATLNMAIRTIQKTLFASVFKLIDELVVDLSI